MKTIKDLLTRCGLSHYTDVFEAQEIDLDVIGELDDADFRELGLPLGPRRKLRRAIAELELGARSRSAPSQAERRHLTVLFCDLADSTAIAERLDPEEMSDILRRYQRVCTDAIDELGGTIAKFMGDGVLAYFGYPTAHEDDAERSVDAALSITEQARSWPTLHGVDCVVRVGIASGTVVVGETIGSESSEEQVAVGDTLNLAARLEGVAGRNEIVIADATRQLLGDSFDVDDRGMHELKGFSSQQRAWTVRGRRSRARFRSEGADRRPMIGRSAELARLRAAWRQAGDGRTVRASIHGEAGFGKSRLVDELRRLESPASSLTFQCAEPYCNTPYWPITRWLSDVAVGAVPTREELVHVHGLDEPLAACVASLWSHPDDMGDLLPANPALVRERTLEGLRRLVLAAVADRPALVAVEDTHWADPSTVELLDRVAGAGGDGILVVETTREPPPRDRPHAIALDRLDREEVAALVVELAHDVDLDPASVRRISERADGIPYYVEQLVDYTRNEGDRGGVDAIPDTLHDALMARLDRRPRARDFLLAAAVVGTSFDTDSVAAAIGVSSELAKMALEDSVADGVIVPDRHRSGAFSFTQPLLRDAAYQSLVRERRTGYHARIARAMLSNGRAIDRPELIARHFALANRPREALDLWERAAELAIGRSASDEAAAHLRAALSALAELPDLPDHDVRELHLHLLLGARLLAIHGFASLDVETVYSRAMELCASTADGADRLAAYWGLWGFHVVRADLSEAADLAAGFVELADRLDHAPARVAAAYADAVTAFYHGRLEASAATFARALDLYDVSHRGECLRQYGLDLAVSVTAYLGWVLALQGRDTEALAAARRAIEIGEEADDPFSIAFATTFAAQTCLFLEQFDAAQAFATTTKEMSFLHGYAQWQGQADIQLGYIEARARPDVDTSPIEQGLDKYVSTGATLALPYTRAWLGEVLRERGELERAAAMVRQGLRETASSGECYYDAELRRLAGQIAALTGDHATAEAELEHARSLARAQGAALIEARVDRTRASLDNEGKQHG